MDERRNPLVDALGRDPAEGYVALRAPGDPPAAYGYREFVETAWKTGNYFRRLGAHEDATVAVVPDASAAVPLAVFGAAVNGATVRVDPPRDVQAKLLVAPGDRIGAFDLPPGAQRVAHSTSVEDPAVHSFGEGVWSENPVFPGDRIFADRAALADAHRTLGREAVGRLAASAGSGIEPGDEVAVRAPLGDARAIVAGIVAPLDVGARVRIAAEEDSAWDVAVVAGDDRPPEDRVVRLDRL